MSVVFVISILFILMFGLGTSVKSSDFTSVAKSPKSLLVGLAAQLIVLPLVAFSVSTMLQADPYLAIGICLIGCCAGGASSNVLTSLFDGNVALSVSLTVATSIVSVFTIPLVIEKALTFYGISKFDLNIPFLKTVMQSFVVIILPLVLGVLSQRWKRVSTTCGKFIRKSSLPLLLIMISLFCYEHSSVIIRNSREVFIPVCILILCSMTVALIVSFIAKIKGRDLRSIIVEVGIQNAAQAITIAISPLLINNSVVAIPAIVYALVMNIAVFGIIASWFILKKLYVIQPQAT